MTSRRSLTDEQTVAIILAIALGSLWKPHHDLATFLTPALGEVAGYVAGIGITAFIAGLFGFVAFAVLKRLNVSHKKSM
jgi:hypothetical protein